MYRVEILVATEYTTATSLLWRRAIYLPMSSYTDRIAYKNDIIINISKYWWQPFVLFALKHRGGVGWANNTITWVFINTYRESKLYKVYPCSRYVEMIKKLVSFDTEILL